MGRLSLLFALFVKGGVKGVKVFRVHFVLGDADGFAKTIRVEWQGGLLTPLKAGKGRELETGSYLC